MSQIVTITAAQPEPEEGAWSNEYGTFKPFVVTVKSEAGNTRDAIWNRKQRDDGTYSAPQVGDRVDTELVQTKKPPGWQLKKPKLVRDDGSVPSYTGRTSGGGQADDRTADIHRQVALKAASALFGPMLAQVNPMTSTTEWWARFWALYEQATNKIEGLITQRQQAQQALPEARNDTERTGQSDVPAAAPGEFEHPQVTDSEGIAF